MALPLSALNPQLSTASWYCVHTQSKREHIAAHWLKLELALETYVPRIRYRRQEARRWVPVIEALFPNYLFARFDLAKQLQEVECVPGVIEVIRFGAHCPAIPDAVIDGLRACVAADHIHVIEDQFVPGQSVQIASGAFQGLEAVITRVLPARQRVHVLLEMLGRQTSVELETDVVASTGNVRERIAGLNSDPAK